MGMEFYLEPLQADTDIRLPCYTIYFKYYPVYINNNEYVMTPHNTEPLFRS